MDLRFIACAFLLMFGVFLFIFASEGLAEFLICIVPLNNATAECIARGIIVAYGVGWYFFCKTAKK